MTVKQAAKELGISISLVYGLLATGKIRHERYGLGRGVIRIPMALEDYRRQVTVAEAPPKREKAGPSSPPV